MLLASLASAQQIASASDPADLSVLEKTWHRTFYVPGRNENPLLPNEDLIQQTRIAKRAIENRDRSLPNQPTESAIPVPVPRPPSGKPVNIYIYKIKVKNIGTKTIKTVDWEYQFLHPGTQEMLGSRQMHSKVKISPGATKVIEGKSPIQPTRLVSADQLDKKLKDQFEERVIIQRIHYGDGSAWRRKP